MVASHDVDSNALSKLDDPAIPAFRELIADGYEIATALAHAQGIELNQVAIEQTAWRPGHSLTLLLSGVESPAASRHYFAATTRPTKGALGLAAGESRLWAWPMADDPQLPGMKTAMAPQQLLGQLGIDQAVTGVQVVSYRPGRRAVVRIQAGDSVLFAKVVRPHKALQMHSIHKRLEQALPVPKSLGYSEAAGVVALQAMPGELMRSLVYSGVGPSAEQLLDVLNCLGAVDTTGLDTTAPDWRVREFSSSLTMVRPDLKERLDELAGRIEEFESRIDSAVVPVHGDFHEAQLLMSKGRISGVIDLDTVRMGHRIDDLATMIGHLSVLATTTTHPQRLQTYAARVLDGFDQTVDPAHLRAAVAAVVLGLATGPFRVLEPNWFAVTEARIAMAEQWIDSARRASGTRRIEGEKCLITN
jgi:aminoglycoside phosphotransferase (APT) family kinase protein